MASLTLLERRWQLPTYGQLSRHSSQQVRFSAGRKPVSKMAAYVLLAGEHTMMRIHVRESREECTLFVEGAIESADAIELESCWHMNVCNGNKAVVINFSGVLRVDWQGRALLRHMYQNGVRFTGARLAIADVLEQIILSAGKH